MTVTTTHSSHMPGLRLRYGRGVGRGRSPPGTAATTQTADGHRMRPVSPCGPPRLAMWRFGCPMIRGDEGGTAGAQSAAARAHTECCPRKSPRTRFFSHTRPSYNRGPGFESPKSIRNDESEGSGGQNFPLRDLPLALRACARAHLRWWHHECRPLPTGASEPTESGVLQVHREGARRRLLPREQEGR